jgi:hypothetical protein
LKVTELIMSGSLLAPSRSITQQKRKGEAERCQKQAQLARKNKFFDYSHVLEFR